jgi:hypothetical protein
MFGWTKETFYEEALKIFGDYRHWGGNRGRV